MDAPANGQASRRVVLTGAVVLSVLAFAAAAPAADPPPQKTKVIKRGGVRFYPEEKRIEMDGRFCLTEGPIELFASARGGKEYESVVTLDADPEILHFCLILMRLKPGDTGPRFQGDPDRAPTGSPVVVKARWKMNETEKVVRAEELCWNAIDKRTMDRTPWVFVGSKKQKDPDTGKTVYWAKIEKVIIAVYRDPFAVLDLPLPLGANDEAFVVNKQLVPKVGTPVTVILEPGPEIEPPPKNAAGGRIFLVDITAGGRVLVGGAEPAELPKALREIAKKAPRDSCRVTADHGFSPQAAAAAFEALAGAGIKIESVETVRMKPGVKDVVTLTVTGGKVHIKGKDVSLDQVKTVVGAAVEGGSGVAVSVEKGTGLNAVAEVLRRLEGIKGAVLRIVPFSP